MDVELYPILDVVDRLQKARVPCAVGGSMLLHSLGLAESYRDVDLTTDAPLSTVKHALTGLTVTAAPHGDGPYRTKYRLSVSHFGAEVDLLGAFAIETMFGVVKIPTVVDRHWQGLPMGSPAVWAVAYRLMGREAKADLLAAYVREHGAPAFPVARLLSEPLPPHIRQEVLSWTET